MSTIIVPDDFSTIQGAINSAANGDTILIREGIYSETLDILKENLMIKAYGDDMVMLDGLDSFIVGIDLGGVGNVVEELFVNHYVVGVRMTGTNCIIRRCKVSENSRCGIRVHGEGNQANINLIQDNGVDALEMGGTGLIAMNNNIVGNALAGVYIFGALIDSLIGGNTIRKHDVGIYLNDEAMANTRIDGNTIYDNQTGIYINGTNNNIQRNLVGSCEFSGILMDGENNISQNNIISECQDGVIIMGNSNYVKGNVLTTMSNTGMTITDNNNSLDKNSIHLNSVGIILSGNFNNMQDNVFNSNTLSNMQNLGEGNISEE